MTTTNRSETPCRVVQETTEKLAAGAEQVLSESDSEFEAARRLATRLGAHHVDGRAEIGFWTPELEEKSVPQDKVFLEVFTPLQELDFGSREQQVRFRRELLSPTVRGEYTWAVVEGMTPGTRERVGSFYQLRYLDEEDTWHTVTDPLAHSTPFGAFAPAEFYEVESLHRNRADLDYYAALREKAGEGGIASFDPPANILQLHVGTATEGGTLADLVRLFSEIAEKVRSGEELTPFEKSYTGYDAVQPLPLEPTIEYEGGEHFWQEFEGEDRDEEVSVKLVRPDVINWGYDIVLSASSAVNPTLLESGRPDELVDLAAGLHNFPGGPILLLFDVVYGHTDNQALELLNFNFFRGANMYGQDVNQQHPVVRAIMLELQRRKVNFGADGIRVDGAQDFKTWDENSRETGHDDEYLQLMSDVVQEVGGTRYHPWMIFEDGRPWPREDWPTASTYREVIDQQPEVFQWGPLTFAHNTPHLLGFWDNRWWRVEEIFEIGSNWISGCANHDTLRRGYQVEPHGDINLNLGPTLPEILANAYDNPAANLLTYGAFPGIPMDFINALVRAPWAFIRNTDDRYGMKIVSEESGFLDWQVDEPRYAAAINFPRLKLLGFTDFPELRRFMHIMTQAIIDTDHDLPAVVEKMKSTAPPLPGPELSVPVLKSIGRAFVQDVHEYENVTRYTDSLDPERVECNLAAREFRRQRPWLMQNLGSGEHYGRLSDSDSTIFYALRQSPDNTEQVFFVANMEGEPQKITPPELPIPDLPTEGWELALAAPGVKFDSAGSSILLADSQGLLLVRKGD